MDKLDTVDIEKLYKKELERQNSLKDMNFIILETINIGKVIYYS